MDGHVVVLTEGGPHIWAIVNGLVDRFAKVTVVMETALPKATLVRWRAHRLGWLSAIGQLGTMVLIRSTKHISARRAADICVTTGIETAPRAGQEIIRVPTANAPELLAEIERLRPDAILLAGCRLLTRNTLAAMPCPVLNYHAGITPAYRGMNGSYWALASGDRDNFGATVHLVDAGVDTGGVLYQVRGKPEAGDTIGLYPLRLAALSREICVLALQDAVERRMSPITLDMPSRQWFHPTIWSYLWTGVTKGVW